MDIDTIKKLTFDITNGSYRCLSNSYHREVKVEFLCPKGHNFSMLWYNFKSHNKRCPVCYNESDRRGESQRFSLSYIKEQASILSDCVCISDIYKNARTKLSWLCTKNHRFEKTWNDFKESPRCSVCSGLKKKAIDEVKDIAEREGYKCISDTYKNAKTKLSWQCTKGHKFEMSWNCFQRGNRCSTCGRISAVEKMRGSNHPNWKGGVTEKSIPLYDTYAPQLEWCEEVRRNNGDPNILEVRCTYCGKWYVESVMHINKRIQALKSLTRGEGRLYCSNNCKKACPIYHKTPDTLMKEDAIRAGRLGWLELNREVQPELRQLVLERDGYKCIKCGSKGPLHCHHISPVTIDPLVSADIDNCLTLCDNCHRKVHKIPGCGYGEIKMEIC